MKTRAYQSGYIAITTAIVLSLLVVALAIALGSSSLIYRFTIVDFVNKQTSLFTANSCLDYARLKLSMDPAYAGNETVNIGSYQCTLQPIAISGSNKVIKAHAAVNGATTNLQLTVVSSTLSTVSLEEVVKF